MRDILDSMLEELGAMFSGHFVPYYKTALAVAGIVAVLFSVVFAHSTIFEGRIAVVDLDHSKLSTELIERINTSSYIKVGQVMHSPTDVVRLTAHDRHLGVLYIPKGLEKSVVTGTRTVTLGYWSDDSNASQNAEILQALHAFIPEAGVEFGIQTVSRLGLGEEAVQAAMLPMTLKSRNLFNPVHSATNSTVIAFVYFFSSLFYGLTTLMIVGRLKVTGLWRSVVFARSPFALIARIVPYSLFLTTGITVVTAVLVLGGQLRFEGNYWMYLPSIFMTGMAFGMLALLMAWHTANPGQGAGLMTFLVPPGFILGGATMATGYAAPWAYWASYAFPLVWQYRFWRDVAVRGEETVHMLSTYGAYLMYLTVLAALIVVRFYFARRKLSEENEALASDLKVLAPEQMPPKAT
ncbi:MAG: ABC transporter permease [Duodenibacillus sp.]